MVVGPAAGGVLAERPHARPTWRGMTNSRNPLQKSAIQGGRKVDQILLGSKKARKYTK